ncbi:MAG: tripartite tricarboxylate transporter substrate binding protein [Rubritepida sp.]|nr:tripartite tricarboxylate transporter substrate binding protein [Rubritepida sp.]
MHRRHLAAALAGTALASGAQAQPRWSPDRPVTFLGPFAAGGSFDITQRAIARQAEPLMGQAITVLNKPGAGGTVMLAELMRARPDGQTIGLLSVNSNSVAPQLQELAFDPVADFQPLWGYGAFLTFVVVAANAPFTSLRDMIAFARREPGRLSIGIAALGSNSHLNTARLAAEENLDVIFVPFTGGAPATTALLGGHIQCAVVSGEVLPSVRDGTLRSLAILNAEKSEEFPDVPTLPELGYSWSSRPWLGVGAPRGLPQPVADRWVEALRAATQQPDYLEVLRRLAIVPMRLGPVELRALMAESLAEHERIARAIRIGRFAAR